MTETKELIDQFSNALLSGQLDDKLDKISQAIQMRRQIHGQIKYMDFKIGDKVRVIDGVRPRRIAGARGEITGFKTKKILVKMAPTNVVWLMNPSSIEKIEDGANTPT